MTLRLRSLLVQTVTSIFLISCVTLNNPFSAKTGTRGNACDTNVSVVVELERAHFTPPEIWSLLKPCETVTITRQFQQDKWGASAALHYTYGDILVYDAAMGFSVRGNLHSIGFTPSSMRGWKEREDRKWLKYMIKRGDSEKREMVFDARNGLDCWRETTTSFEQGKQSALSIAYHCWEPNKSHYPPLTIGGWIRYWDGEPVYDLNIDKDLIDPVFATLKVKDIKPEVYAERMAIHEEKVRQECKRRLKTVRKKPGKEYSSYYIERLDFCGYDTSKLKREEE